jgi:hypothetical protein
MEGFHEPVGGGVGSVQKNWLHDLPWSECGGTLSVNMQKEEIYQWGLMVRTPSTPEKGRGQ